MAVTRLHDDEIDISDALVRGLITQQFPQWAALPIERLTTSGTVNVIYRLGDRYAVRLPRAKRFEERDTDCWLRFLNNRLPIAIPEPVAAGEPTDVYPVHWTIHRWLDGETWRLDRVDDPCAAAESLAEVIHSLRALDPADSSCPLLWDGGVFTARDETIRAAAPRAAGVDAQRVLRAWDSALAAEPWSGDGVFIHWDLLPGNVLVNKQRISAVIDWGALAVGDPARDLLPTWTLFDGPSRETFRNAMRSDADLWARARGWALAFVVGVAYYKNSNPVFADECRSTVAAVLDEVVS